MALDVTEVNRNLHTRVTMLGLEFEDLFVVLAMGALMNLVGHFVGGEIAGLPLNLILQFGVPLVCVPFLMLFKYGKPRGYLRDLLRWHTHPRRYCAAARDSKFITEYLKENQCR